MSKLCNNIICGDGKDFSYDKLFDKEEQEILVKVENKKKEQQQILSCKKPAYIGLFFDGTNNSYRHAIENNTEQESNVARLYDVFPGQCVPGILSPETNWKEELEIYKRYFCLLYKSS